jgi:hypothetical protein
MISLRVGIGIVVSGLAQSAWAQMGEDPIDRLKSCSHLESSARMGCVDNVLRDITKPGTPAGAGGQNWVISETTSPVDYSPQLTAVIVPDSAAEGAPSSLTIRCRGGRTELLVGSNVSLPSFGGNELRVGYRVNDGPVAQQQAVAIAAGNSVLVRGDIVALVRSWPDNARITIQIHHQQGTSNGSVFHVGEFTAVRQRIGTVCRWPRQ